jgi:hypothetical protein
MCENFINNSEGIRSNDSSVPELEANLAPRQPHFSRPTNHVDLSILFHISHPIKESVMALHFLKLTCYR